MSRRNPSADLDEESPLIAAQNTGHDGDVDNQELSDVFELEDSTLETKSTWYLILLTISIAGLQVFWSLEFSNGSPFLLSLGMSKSLLAIVWLAGPLTGSLVQPYIGIVSDRCRVSWGKRKPFMIAGLLGTIVASIMLSYSREIVWVLGPWAKDAQYAGLWKGLTITLATIMMWCLDFSINTVQAAIRAFIVDNAPAHQQESANAWASRMTGVGNVFGYIFGYLNLSKYFYFFGNTQFKVLCVIASIAFSATIVVSILGIKERNPQDEPPLKNDESSGGIIAFFRQVFSSVRNLTPQIRSVCTIQLFHWIGWFPFLFYTTTYIGQLYVNPYLHPGLTNEEIDALWAKATRYATLALLISAVVSFACSIFLPFIVVPSYKPSSLVDMNESYHSIAPSSPITSSHRNASFNGLGNSRPSKHTLRIVGSKFSMSWHFMEKLRIPGLSLRRAWLMAQLLHAVCLFSTFLITTPTMATVMTAFIGVSWSLTLWAPFALISSDIAKRKETQYLKQRQKFLNDSEPNGSSHYNGADIKKDDGYEDRAGIVLGLHNVAVSSPQVVATLLSSIIFKFLQKDRGTPNDDSVAWTLRMGGVATLVAAYLTWRMREAGDEEDERN